MNLIKNVKLAKIENTTAAGQTVLTSTTVDMAGYDGCLFLISFAVIAGSAVTSIEVHTSTDDSSYTALLGTGVTVADDDDNGLFWVDIHKPLERYLRLIVNRATQDSTLDCVIALQYGPMSAAPSHASTIAGGELHISPIRGTA